MKSVKRLVNCQFKSIILAIEYFETYSPIPPYDIVSSQCTSRPRYLTLVAGKGACESWFSFGNREKCHRESVR